MNNKAAWIALVIIFFIAGAAGSYVLMNYFPSATARPQQTGSAVTGTAEGQEFMLLRIYLPKDGRLAMTEKKLPRRIRSLAIAEAVTEEFFRAQAEGAAVPQGVKVLGIYRDGAQNLYVDLSDELRRNFRGDALAEFVLLKGLYDSLLANLQDFQDLKILVEGREIETLGGHLYLKYPLRSMLAAVQKTEGRAPHD